MRTLTVAAALAAALLAAGCRPEKPGGYQAVTYRETAPQDIEATHPDAPEVSPAVLAAMAPRQVVLQNPPAGVTQAMVDEGQQLFGRVCSACHGAGGVGTAAGPALDDREWLNISGAYPEIVQIINTGVPDPRQFPGAMPPRGGGTFSDDEVARIGAYVYAISQQEAGS